MVRVPRERCQGQNRRRCRTPSGGNRHDPVDCTGPIVTVLIFEKVAHVISRRRDRSDARFLLAAEALRLPASCLHFFVHVTRGILNRAEGGGGADAISKTQQAKPSSYRQRYDFNTRQPNPNSRHDGGPGGGEQAIRLQELDERSQLGRGCREPIGGTWGEILTNEVGHMGIEQTTFFYLRADDPCPRDLCECMHAPVPVWRSRSGAFSVSSDHLSPC